MNCIFILHFRFVNLIFQSAISIIYLSSNLSILLFKFRFLIIVAFSILKILIRHIFAFENFISFLQSSIFWQFSDRKFFFTKFHSSAIAFFSNSNSSSNFRKFPRVSFYKFYSWESSSRHIFLILLLFLNQVGRGQEEPRTVVAQDFLRLINTKEKDTEGVGRNLAEITTSGAATRYERGNRFQSARRRETIALITSLCLLCRKINIIYECVPANFVIDRSASRIRMNFIFSPGKNEEEKGTISFVPPTFNWDWKLNGPRTFRNRPSLCFILPCSFWNE